MLSRAFVQRTQAYSGCVFLLKREGAVDRRRGEYPARDGDDRLQVFQVCEKNPLSMATTANKTTVLRMMPSVRPKPIGIQPRLKTSGLFPTLAVPVHRGPRSGNLLLYTSACTP